VRVVLFDLDETLYPRGNGVIARVDARINTYLADRMGVPAAEVDAVRIRLRDAYGTTMRGLEMEHAIDVDDYLAHIHDVPIEDLLEPAPALRAALRRIPERKAVFSNAVRSHVTRVLGLLGIADVFEAVFALEDLGHRPKPDPAAYRVVTEALGVPATACVLIDDTRQNLEAAADLGMRTVWVHPEPTGTAGVDHVVPDVHAVETALAGLRRGLRP
jgi:putative hydrolase of the HAD superfamily